MSLDRFIRAADSLVEFEVSFNDNRLPTSSVFAIETHKDELKSIWNMVKAAYEICMSNIQNTEEGDNEDEADEAETIKEKFKSSYITYSRCVSRLSEIIHEMSVKTPVLPANLLSSNPINPDSYIPPSREFSNLSENREHSFKLPACEIPIFHGDYSCWPTFRDLFSAICIKNSRLSPVEKLFYLMQKTKDEANEIVSKSPLTNEGFSSAWSNLCARYENKRILVNLQLRKLFQLQLITVESGVAIKELQRDINASIYSLKLFNINVDSWDPIFVYLCSNRLPASTLTIWEQTLTDKSNIPRWGDLDSFLTNRYRTLESVYEMKHEDKTQQSKSKNPSKAKGSPNGVQSYQANITQNQCQLCPQDSHVIRKCPRFLNMDHAQKLSEIKNSNLCLNCFSGAHAVRSCKSKYSCFKCGKRHNTLLHKEPESTLTSSNVSDPNPTSAITSPAPFHSIDSLQSTTNPSQGVQNYFVSHTRGVLLGTARVIVGHRGLKYTARALLDSGSEGTFISDNLFNKLKLPFKRTSAKISGLNNSVSADVQKQCTFTLGSPRDETVQIPTTALVVPQLSGNLPSRTVNIDSFSNLPDVLLADPQFHESSNIDILLGGDLLPHIMLSGFRKNICGSLMAQETIFGWILSGPIPVKNISCFATCVSYHCEISLEKEISRFWEVEDLPRETFLSISEKICDELYSRTTKRNEEGRYVVSLPFKKEFPEEISLGQSRNISIAQFLRNEARLIKTPKLKEEYDSVIQEYEELGHMSPCTTTNSSDKSSHYYLPHHAIIKPESTTTKLRVVFNASSPTSNGLSLNDILYTGPPLQNDLTVLILKWRIFRYVFNGDLQKMYRQILINPDHRAFQKIIHRKNPTNPLQDFQLNTVTFGVNCAPYLAIRTLLQLADDIQNEYPLASQILRHFMYVDDILAGAHSITSAIQSRDELILALKSAGFKARKWTANDKRILSDLPVDHLLSEDFLEFDNTSTAKPLGIRWNARTDSFYFFTHPFPVAGIYTKRLVISQIAKLFDPAGWLAPIVVLAKIIMQKVWIDKIDWDDELKEDTLYMWKSFLSNYHYINSIKVPRWVEFTPESQVQFHCFCDASEKAYAAALYIRVSTGYSIKSHLILSKTKIAPIKTLSIPRLELCGAVLLADLIDTVLPKLGISNYTLLCWTDSTIVLSWLAKNPCTWNTFVANRVSKITNIIHPSMWNHVKTEDNPADQASRGVPPQDLIDNKLWWNGPQWLSEPTIYPLQNLNSINETDLEKKSIKVHTSYISNYEDPLERFSSLPRALRVISYIFRFMYRTHPRYRCNYHGDSTTISTSEILLVRNRLIIISQKSLFSKEYHSLSLNRSILNSSALKSLNPFLDADGMMRICGRLENSPALSYNEKHPILLPYSCQYSRLLVKFIHQISLHGGNQLVLRLLRTNFWIPKIQNLIKTTIHNCKPCVLYKKRCQKQLMSALPPSRSEISRPFTHTGLDFAGPFDIKAYAGRTCRVTKGYVCIFVCFSTKSIHLEATSDLSTPAFLAAFSRFISRRGCPLHLHSDNGQTFVGASRQLAKEFVQTSQQAVVSNYSHMNIQWHFIPPGAPHMGGLWEAGVKSFKQHFRKTASGCKYTFEEFQTLLAKIEACLNSRPISPMSENPSDLGALTPGHFLIGAPILVPIDPATNESSMSICNRWQRLKVIHHHFSIRWKNEYLKELHKRNKWRSPEEDLKENSMVVVKDDNQPPNCWHLGRVVKVFPGRDNRVRVAEILTQRGSLLRPITKLVVLPLESS